jgi:flagellar motor switch protein FliN/FliY
MADERVMSQEEIEKLFSEGSVGSGATPGLGKDPAAPAGEDPSGSAAGAEDGPGDSTSKSAASGEGVKPLVQEDIARLLEQGGKAPPPTPPPGGPATGEGSIAEKDIDFLLQQAEQALESIAAADADVLPQGLLPFCLEELTGAPASTDAATLDLIRDVDLDLKIELGQTHMYLEDVLKLRKGSVVPLDKLAGDPVDIYVNGRLIARGEVLVLNDNFCVRVAELMTGVQVQA